MEGKVCVQTMHDKPNNWKFMIKVTVVNNVTLLCQCHSYTIRMLFSTPLLNSQPIASTLLASLPSLIVRVNKSHSKSYGGNISVQYMMANQWVQHRKSIWHK